MVLSPVFVRWTWSTWSRSRAATSWTSVLTWPSTTWASSGTSWRSRPSGTRSSTCRRRIQVGGGAPADAIGARWRMWRTCRRDDVRRRPLALQTEPRERGRHVKLIGDGSNILRKVTWYRWLSVARLMQSSEKPRWNTVLLDSVIRCSYFGTRAAEDLLTLIACRLWPSCKECETRYRTGIDIFTKIGMCCSYISFFATWSTWSSGSSGRSGSSSSSSSDFIAFVLPHRAELHTFWLEKVTLKAHPEVKVSWNPVRSNFVWRGQIAYRLVWKLIIIKMVPCLTLNFNLIGSCETSKEPWCRHLWYHTRSKIQNWRTESCDQQVNTS